MPSAFEQVTIEVDVKMKLRLPGLPNFIIGVAEGTQETSFDVGKFDNGVLSKLADEWKAAFLVHAQERRKKLKGGV